MINSYSNNHQVKCHSSANRNGKSIWGRFSLLKTDVETNDFHLKLKMKHQS